jgi:hypothetical protein
LIHLRLKNPKTQIPNPKFQINSKSQKTKKQFVIDLIRN